MPQQGALDILRSVGICHDLSLHLWKGGLVARPGLYVDLSFHFCQRPFRRAFRRLTCQRLWLRLRLTCQRSWLLRLCRGRGLSLRGRRSFRWQPRRGHERTRLPLGPWLGCNLAWDGWRRSFSFLVIRNWLGRLLFRARSPLCLVGLSLYLDGGQPHFNELADGTSFFFCLCLENRLELNPYDHIGPPLLRHRHPSLTCQLKAFGLTCQRGPGSAGRCLAKGVHGLCRNIAGPVHAHAVHRPEQVQLTPHLY